MNLLKSVTIVLISMFLMLACGENGRKVKVDGLNLDKTKETQKAIKATGLDPVTEVSLEEKIIAAHLLHSDLVSAMVIKDAGGEVAKLKIEQCYRESTNRLQARGLNLETDLKPEDLEYFSKSFNEIYAAKVANVNAENDKSQQEEPQAELILTEDPVESSTEVVVKEITKNNVEKLAPNLKNVNYYKFNVTMKCEVEQGLSAEVKLSYAGYVSEFEVRAVSYILINAGLDRNDLGHYVTRNLTTDDDQTADESKQVVIEEDNSLSPLMSELFILEAPDKAKLNSNR